MRRRWALLLCGGLISASAFAVSKVGTGKLSNPEVGFSTLTPQNYQRAMILKDQDVRFDSGHIKSPDGPGYQPVFVIAYLLKNEQPQWANKTDRQEFRQEYFRLGWEEVPHRDPCVQMFRRESKNQTTWTLSWGSGRGVIFTGPKNVPEIVQSLQNMSTQLALEPGACSWK